MQFIRGFPEALGTVQADKFYSFSNGRSLFLSCAPFFLQFITQSWNQAGENHSDLALLIQGYLEQNTGILWLFVSATYAVSGHYLSARLGRDGKSPVNQPSYLLSQGLVLTALLFKFCSTLTITPGFVSFAPQRISSAAGYMNITTIYRVLSTRLIAWMAHVLLRLREGPIQRKGTTVRWLNTSSLPPCVGTLPFFYC